MENREWSEREVELLSKACTASGRFPDDFEPGTRLDIAQTTLTFEDGHTEVVQAAVGGDLDATAAEAAVTFGLGDEGAVAVAKSLHEDAKCRVLITSAMLGDEAEVVGRPRRLEMAPDGSRLISIDMKRPGGVIERASLEWRPEETALQAAARFLHEQNEDQHSWSDRRLRALENALEDRVLEDARAQRESTGEGEGGEEGEGEEGEEAALEHWQRVGFAALQSVEDRLFEAALRPQVLVTLEVAVSDALVLELDLMEGETTRDAAAGFLERQGLPASEAEYNEAVLVRSLEDRLREGGGVAPRVLCEVQVTVDDQTYTIAHPSHLAPVATARRFVSESALRGTTAGDAAVPAVAAAILQRISDNDQRAAALAQEASADHETAATRARQAAADRARAFATASSAHQNGEDLEGESGKESMEITLVLAGEAFALEFEAGDVAAGGAEALAGIFCDDQWVVLGPLLQDELAREIGPDAAGEATIEMCTAVVANLIETQIGEKIKSATSTTDGEEGEVKKEKTDGE